MEFRNIEGLVSNTPPKLEFSKIGGAISSQVFKVVVKQIIFLEPPMDMPVNTKKMFWAACPQKNFIEEFVKKSIMVNFPVPVHY